jgi:hypothetical protein
VSTVAIAILSLTVGAFLAVYCPRVALREFRAGVAKGRVNDFRRDAAPISFWLSIAATLFAGVLGVLFLIVGLAMIGREIGLFR